MLTGVDKKKKIDFTCTARPVPLLSNAWTENNCGRKANGVETNVSWPLEALPYGKAYTGWQQIKIMCCQYSNGCSAVQYILYVVACYFYSQQGRRKTFPGSLLALPCDSQSETNIPDELLAKIFSSNVLSLIDFHMLRLTLHRRLKLFLWLATISYVLHCTLLLNCTYPYVYYSCPPFLDVVQRNYLMSVSLRSVFLP